MPFWQKPVLKLLFCVKRLKDIVSEKKKAVNEIKDEISDIAILIAEKVVEKEITPADHEKLIAQFIDRVGE